MIIYVTFENYEHGDMCVYDVGNANGYLYPNASELTTNSEVVWNEIMFNHWEKYKKEFTELTYREFIAKYGEVEPII